MYNAKSLVLSYVTEFLCIGTIQISRLFILVMIPKGWCLFALARNIIAICKTGWKSFSPDLTWLPSATEFAVFTFTLNVYIKRYIKVKFLFKDIPQKVCTCKNPRPGLTSRLLEKVSSQSRQKFALFRTYINCRELGIHPRRNSEQINRDCVIPPSVCLYVDQ